SYALAPPPPPLAPLPLHDALPIYRFRGDGPAGRLPHLQHPRRRRPQGGRRAAVRQRRLRTAAGAAIVSARLPPLRCMRSSPAERSEEHTSELQSRENLVCRLLLEK